MGASHGPMPRGRALGRCCIDGSSEAAQMPQEPSIIVAHRPQSGHEIQRPSKYQTKYRVSNGAEYDQALVKRGDLTLWISEDAIASWKPAPAPTGRRGAQRKFSRHAIEAALTLRLVFKLPRRQAEGFLRSVPSLMALDGEGEWAAAK